MTKIVKLERVSIKDHKEINEAKIQQLIFDDPSILGLGALTGIQREKIQPSGGRLDLLLMESDSKTRYEVELQLGATDPSHIIRTIEYWDVERNRFPQYSHCAVIIAEDITSRFLNVISLFNGTIPIIALQVSAYKVAEDSVSIVFTKVLDKVEIGDNSVEVLEVTDRSYWENKSTLKMLKFMDEMFSTLVSKDLGYEVKYNKFYVGLIKDGMSKNFIRFEPKKNFIWVHIKSGQIESLEEDIASSNLDINYDSTWSQYSIRLTSIKDYTDNKNLINELVDMAKEKFKV